MNWIEIFVKFIYIKTRHDYIFNSEPHQYSIIVFD